MSNPIVTENQNTGTTDWLINRSSNGEIQCYCNATSVNVGDTLKVYVSTASAGTSYTLTIYRLGWYSGTGARLMTSSSLIGTQQGYWDYNSKVFVNASSVYQDSTTHLTEARWTASYTLTIPGTWVTGCYFVRCTDANGYQTYCHFAVKGNTTADYALCRPHTTDTAYNSWGGYSLYSYNSTGGVAATKVSFDRPSGIQDGSDGFLIFEAPMLKWMERRGYNLSYLSDIDVHVNAAQLKNYKAYISLGHDEYWTKEQYDGVTAARDAGVGLAFMGADDIDTQVRIESGGQNGANRTVTCYRVTSSPNTLAQDPSYGVDNTRVTASWSDPILNRPQNALLGIKYASIMAHNSNTAWTVDPNCTSSYIVGTGLVPGQSYGYDLVGYEFDKVQVGDVHNPTNIQTIGTTNVIDTYSAAQTSSTVTYVAPSGALVFSSGSINWSCCLDAFRYQAQPGGTPAEIPSMQNFFTNILSALVINHNKFTVGVQM